VFSNSNSFATTSPDVPNRTEPAIIRATAPLPPAGNPPSVPAGGLTTAPRRPGTPSRPGAGADGFPW
jgi:hypothetical protein